MKRHSTNRYYNIDQGTITIKKIAYAFGFILQLSTENIHNTIHFFMKPSLIFDYRLHNQMRNLKLCLNFNKINPIKKIVNYFLN